MALAWIDSCCSCNSARMEALIGMNSTREFRPYDSDVVSGSAEQAYRRLPGVTIISLLTFLLAAYNAYSLVVALTADTLGLGWVLGWIKVFFIFVFLVAAIGLWKLQRWAHQLAIMIYGVIAASGVLDVLLDALWRSHSLNATALESAIVHAIP